MDETARRNLVKKAIWQKTISNMKNKSTAKAALVRDGFTTKSGDLTPEYGGPVTKRMITTR